MIREDIQAYLADYRGVLGWSAYSEPFGMSIPDIEIPIYVKEGSIPIRKPKLTEVSTIQRISPGAHKSITTGAYFFGAPDILQTQLTGWIITPILNQQWVPKDKNGNDLNWGNLSYCDIISYFIQGRFNRNVGGAWQRKDPDYYISPRGHKYSKPIIAAFQPAGTPIQRKQTFEMTLYLES